MASAETGSEGSAGGGGGAGPPGAQGDGAAAAAGSAGASGDRAASAPAAGVVTPRPLYIPLTRSTHTFKELHIQRINETEASMIQQVKRNRKKWEREVRQTRSHTKGVRRANPQICRILWAAFVPNILIFPKMLDNAQPYQNPKPPNICNYMENT